MTFVAISAIKNESTKPFQGPVYDIDRDHHFQQLMVHAQELKNLHGPVYDVSKDHQVTILAIKPFLSLQLNLQRPYF